MIKLKSKKEEYKLFQQLSEEWWNEDGKFKILHKIRPLRMRYILDQFENNKLQDLDILDVGCGGGLICEPLAKLGGKVTGIDFIENNIKVAKLHSRENNLKINYKCQDIEKSEFKEKYDLIIVFEILEHLDNWKEFLFKISKSLKKNGKIIISTINRNFLSKFLAIYFAENILKWVPKDTHDYNKFIKPEEIILFTKNKKLTTINIRGLSFDPISFNWSLSTDTKINYFCTLIKSN